MKRISRLYDKICDIQNLYLAFYRAAKGKRSKHSAVRYEQNLDSNIQELRRQLLAHDWHIGAYHYFLIHDPKLRNICAAAFEERVLHHAIINVLDPVFERMQIFDSYACRKGKGTQRALLRCKEFAGKYKYAVKLDVRKYFDSICHDVLSNQLRRKFKDRQLLALLDCIIDSYSVQPGKGIPIGNLTSQYFANYYLSFMDRFVKETLGVGGYLRYMDDFVLFSDSLSELKSFTAAVSAFLDTEFHLVLKEPVFCKSDCGMPFLGFKVYDRKIQLSRKSRLRLEERYRLLENQYRRGFCTDDDLVRHVVPIFSWAALADTCVYRRILVEKRGIVY